MSLPDIPQNSANEFVRALGAKVVGRVEEEMVTAWRWRWTCECGATRTEMLERDAALALYFHRRNACTSTGAPMNESLPEQMVTAAARGILHLGVDKPLDGIASGVIARAALEAAGVPALLAERDALRGELSGLRRFLRDA